MDHYRLLDKRYWLPTPAGAFHAASGDRDSPARDFLFALMSDTQSHLGDEQQLQQWAGSDTPDSALELAYQLQQLTLIQGDESPTQAPNGPFEEILPGILAQLSSTAKALLADPEGLYIATHGFHHETAEELAALSADVAKLHQRHQQLLNHHLGLGGDAWSLSNPAGHSQMGFWPLHIGSAVFSLVIADIPFLNQPAFRDLVWVLSRRYAFS